MGIYALGNWTTSTRQDRGLARLFNRLNRDLIVSAQQAGTLIFSGGTGYAVGQVLTMADSGVTTTPAQFSVTGVTNGGAVTSVQMLGGTNEGGIYASHQSAANHQTTVSPTGGSGCVLRVNFYVDIPDMVTRNGGILDRAAFSYREQVDLETQGSISAAIPNATSAQLDQIASILGVTLPA